MNPLVLAVLFCLISIECRQTVVVQTILTPSPCHVSNDRIYHGLFVNCERMGISALPLPDHWIPNGTTTLYLSFNCMTYLPLGSFPSTEKWVNLRELQLSHNKISSLDPYVFSGLKKLQTLVLNDNEIDLDKETLSGNVFKGLSNLRELYLGYNKNNAKSGSYPTSLFSDLNSLVTLALDTFNGDLELGSLFNNTLGLSNLELSGGMTTITNNSFEGFSSVSLKKLSIPIHNNLGFTEPGAFRFLHYLESYELRNPDQDIRTTLESLSPFVNRNMSSLVLTGLGTALQDLTVWDSILTHHLVRYLSQICVEKFTLTNSNILIVELGVFINSVWKRCLKYLDMSDNPIKGHPLEMWLFSKLDRLEFLNMMGLRYAWNYRKGRKFKPYVWHPPECPARFQLERHPPESLARFQLESLGRIQVSTRSADDLQNISRNIAFVNDGPHRNLSMSISKREQYSQFQVQSAALDIFPKKGMNKNSSSKSYYYLPKNLRFFLMNAFSHYLGAFDNEIYFKQGDKLEELHIAENGIKEFTAPIKGLPNVKLLDISKNDGSIMSSSFLDSFPSIIHLNMADMRLDIKFMADHSKRLFDNLFHLRTLNLSKNGLRHLSKNVFMNNTNLSVLILNENRFESLPFSLYDVPQLCLLDLRMNSFRIMSESDMANLERHLEVRGSFSLNLEGNEFSCGCDNLRFLSWLQRTKIHLDNNREYSCVLDSGQRTTTGKVGDLDPLWRKCHGQIAFWITMTLACLIMLGYSCCIMLPKFKTQLKAFILKTIWTPFVIKTPADYPIGVYIGYADQDTTLACRSLRPFIEEKLCLSTYIRHRDLLPASNMAESIMVAIHSSWRVLLVVSHHFLEDPWSYYILQASTYAVQADNPGRLVFVLVNDDGVEALLPKLPQCILQAVQEESIVNMTRKGNIT